MPRRARGTGLGLSAFIGRGRQLGAGAAIALFAALAFPALGGLQILLLREALLADARHDARTDSHALAQHADRVIEGVDLLLSETVAEAQRAESPAATQPGLRNRIDVLRQVTDIALFDAAGVKLAGFPAGPRPSDEAGRSAAVWHRDAADRTLHVGPTALDPATGKPVLTFSRRFDGRDGGFAGVVQVALASEAFQSVYDSIEIGPKGTIALWLQTGTLLVRRPMAPAAAGLASLQAVVGPLFATGRLGAEQSVSPLDGVERLVAFEHLDRYPLVVSASIAVDDALSGWWHEATLEGLILALASAALVGLAVGLERHQRRAAFSELKSRRSDAMYRLLAENSSDLIVITPPGAGLAHRSYVSPSVVSIVGWSPEEFATLEAAAVLHPDDLDRVRGEFGKVSPSCPWLTSQFRMKHRQGHFFWVEATSQWTASEAGAPVIVTTARDITARRLAEEALKDSESRYRLLAESSSDMVTRSSLDGVLLYASPASIEVTGYQPGDLVGMPLRQFIHPDDADRVETQIAQSRMRGSDTLRQLYRVGHKRGTWIWVEVQARHVRLPGTDRIVETVASLRDVTQRQLLQQQLEASVRLLRLTLDSMDQGLVVLSPDRRFNVWNARALTLLGLEGPREALSPGEPASAVVPAPEQRFPWLASVDLSEDGRPCEHRLPNGAILEVRHTSMAGGESLLTFSDITHLKRAETEAREANRMLVLAEELARVGHWRWDFTQDRVWWSKQMYRLHGLDPEGEPPLITTMIDRYHPDDHPMIQETMAVGLANGEGYTLAARVVLPDGTIRQTLSRSLVERDAASDKVVALFGAVLDVTELTQTQRELSEKSGWLETTLNNMDQGLVTLTREGRVSLTNPRFAELLDLPDALLDRPDLALADIATHLGPDSSGLSGPAALPAVGTHEHTSGDGRVLEVRTGSLPDGGVIQTYTDITVRREAEFAVRQSEARYRMLAESTSDVITQLGLDFKRRYVSSSCRSILGYEPEEMLGATPSASIHPDDAAGVRAAVRELVAGAVHGQQTMRTYRTRHKKGHWVWLETAINLMCDHRGIPESLICSLRDVTQRQRTAEHLEKARVAAENAARLKTEFVANMSHELRTPLTGILGIHDMLAHDPTLGPAQKRYVSIARDAGRSLLAIVNDVLDFSKIEAGELAIERLPFGVVALVESCRTLASEQASGKPLTIVVATEDAACLLLGDAARLRQILLNLMTNAIKFTEAGTVTIGAAYRRETGVLRLEVADTGIGIAPDKLPLLFRRFSQADTSTTRRYGGTGLGLAISKSLVELMGGVIGVDSVVGQGTTVWIELPLPEAPSTVDRADDTAHRPPLVPCRVLLAEDNAVNQEIISAVLEQRGHVVTIVENGAAATAAVVGTSTFDVILMDVQMPVMDGLSATRAIRAAEASSGRAPIPIIGLTANAMLGDIQRCREVGMDAHVAKPIEWAQLLSAIDEVTAPPLKAAG